jgi:hypothetical protein
MFARVFALQRCSVLELREPSLKSPEGFGRVQIRLVSFSASFSSSRFTGIFSNEAWQSGIVINHDDSINRVVNVVAHQNDQFRSALHEFRLRDRLLVSRGSI